MPNPTLPTKSDLNGNPTAGTFKTALGQFYDYVAGLVANMIPFTAIGNITATNVQTAIQELDTKKLALAGGTMTGALNEAKGANIASAATINLTTATGNLVHVTGTTAITAVTLGSGMRREVIFDGILTLTHHATNNNLPSAANITTAVGDRATYISDGTTVYCVKYQKANGTAVIAPTTSIVASVRQTVLSGPVDANGNAAQLAIGTGLAINELGSSKSIVTTWANGYDQYGATDYTNVLNTDITAAWSALTANSTLYLYKDINPTTGAVTRGFTTLVPINQGYAPSSPTTGQYWFNTNSYVGQYWSGSAWVSVQRVFVGECVTGASTVTSVTAYAYQGKYNALFAVVAATEYVKNHNIGTDSIIVDGYTIGAGMTQKISGFTMDASGQSYGSLFRSPTRLTVKLTTGYTAFQQYYRNSANFPDGVGQASAGNVSITVQRSW